MRGTFQPKSSPIATAGNNNNRNNTSNQTPECRFFPEAMFQFQNSLKEEPEITATQPWVLHTTTTTTGTTTNKKYPTWHFPGLSHSLLKETFKGKRTLLVGDSTLFFMERWLQTLLYNKTKQDLNFLEHLNMTMANYNVNPDMDPDVGWNPDTPAHYYSKQDGTVVAWDGHRGMPGEAACHWDAVYEQITAMRPHVLVVNFGLHWLHLMQVGRDVPLCYVRAWLTYEDWLASIVLLAQEAGVKLLLFKTTNAVCTDHFWGEYSDGVTLYQNRNVEQTRAKCKRAIQAMVRDHTKMGTTAATKNNNDTLLYTNDNIVRYCQRAVLDEYGAKDLNLRLQEFVHNYQAKNANTNSNMTVAIFNDHDIQSCTYATLNDGRHYHPLNLMRIRMLANMIQCLYPKKGE